VFDLAQGREVRVFSDHLPDAPALVFSPDGRQIASGGADFAVRIYDVATGTLETRLFHQADYILGLAFSPDGRTLAASLGSGPVLLWNLAEGNVQRQMATGWRWERGLVRGKSRCGRSPRVEL
jgi:WD40 repeat protein